MAVPVFMLISGYVNALSYERRGIAEISEAYRMKNIIDKLIRYTVPFAIVFVVEEILFFLFGPQKELSNLLFRFIAGGTGRGSYYYPILLQFVFLYPLLYFLIKKYAFRGLLGSAFINFMYELLQRSYGMNEECYRLLIFRYIFIIAVGCYFAFCFDEMQKKWLAISFVIGTLFIILYCYLAYEPKIIIYWTRTSFIACFIHYTNYVLLCGKIV